jgi:cell division protein ZapA
MSQPTVTVKVANKTLKIACPVGEESALLAAGHEVTSRFHDINSKSQVSTSIEQTILMTALNLANDLLKTQTAAEKDKLALQSKIDLLQSTIEQALNVNALKNK